MKSHATVSTSDLGAAINYLEGLEVILRQLANEQRGTTHDADPLIEQLTHLDEAVEEWAPLRYQADSGTGWQYVGENLAGIRHRLVESYGNAVL